MAVGYKVHTNEGYRVMSYFRRDDEALLAAALTGFT